MFRLIILFVLLAVSFVVVKLLKANWERRAGLGKSNKNNKPLSDNMVQCLYCGVYFPEKKVIKKGENVFCSLNHAKQYKD